MSWSQIFLSSFALTGFWFHQITPGSQVFKIHAAYHCQKACSRGKEKAQAYLPEGATAWVGNCEYHVIPHYLGPTLVAAAPARNDEITCRVAQGLEVGPAHTGLHVIRQTKQVWWTKVDNTFGRGPQTPLVLLRTFSYKGAQILTAGTHG